MAQSWRRPIGTLFASLCLVVVFPRVGGAADDAEARWRREYPRAAETLEAAASQFRAVGSARHRWLDGMIYQVEDLVVGRSGDRTVYSYDGITQQERAGKKDRKPGLVACITDEYKFYLRKSADDSPYLVERYGSELGNEDLVTDNMTRYARSATRYMGQTLSQRMRPPAFRLLAAEEVDSEDGSADRWVRLRYQFEGEFRSEDGSIWLEPARSWAIRRVDLESTSQEDESDRVDRKFVVNYPNDEAVRLIPNHVDDLVQTSNPNVYQQFQMTLTEIEPGPPLDSMFRLSGYGLPDVPLRPVPARRVFSWRNPLLWGSLAVAIVAFLALRWLRRGENRDVVASR